MAVLLSRPPIITQPQRLTLLDWSNPITQGLVFSAPLHPVWGMRDLVSGKLATKTGLATQGIGREGVYAVFGTSNYADFTLPNGFTSSSPFTVAWTQEPRSTSAFSTVLNIKPTGAANAFLIYQSDSNASYYFVAGPRTGNVPLFSAVGAATNGVADRYVLTGSSGMGSGIASGYTLWRNGVKMTTVSTASLGANTTASFRVGALDSATDPFEGLLGNMDIWARVITDGEALAWCRNPYCKYLPQPSRLWWANPAAGGGAGFFSRYYYDMIGQQRL